MWFWFGLAALALIGELASGTFYLLLVAAGFGMAGLAAWAEATLLIQLLVCAAVVVLGIPVLRRLGVLHKRGPDSTRNADVNLDIGQTVTVQDWAPGGVARVWYRGAHWDVAMSGNTPPTPGAWRIVAVRGSQLIVEPAFPPPPA